MLYTAVMLDHCYKFFYLQYVFKNMYRLEIRDKMKNLVKSTLYDVFEEYKKVYQFFYIMPFYHLSGASGQDQDDDSKRRNVRDKRKK